jgi:hypothetical protein
MVVIKRSKLGLGGLDKIDGIEVCHRLTLAMSVLVSFVALSITFFSLIAEHPTITLHRIIRRQITPLPTSPDVLLSEKVPRWFWSHGRVLVTREELVEHGVGQVFEALRA